MAATIAALALPRYGWGVITTKGEFAVVPVTNWAHAQRTMPYQWLNTHRLQPAPPGETLPLVEETWQLILKRRRQANLYLRKLA
jgi:hypothetical protein